MGEQCGAFPQFAHNPGTGEPNAARTLRPADQQDYHDPDRPSAIILPVRSAPGPPAPEVT